MRMVSDTCKVSFVYTFIEFIYGNVIGGRADLPVFFFQALVSALGCLLLLCLLDVYVFSCGVPRNALIDRL